MYKEKTKNKHTNYGLPIKSDMINRVRECRSNNIEIDSPPDYVF